MVMTPAPETTAVSQAVGVSQQAQQMQRALRHYLGQGRRSLLPRMGDPDDNVQLGLARLIVDAGVTSLFGQDCPSEVLGPQPEPKQDWLDEVWRRNRRMLTLQKLATNGGIAGHTFARILPTTPWPRITVIDPLTVTIRTDPDDIDSVWRFTIQPPQAPPQDEGEPPPPPRRTIIANPSGQAGYRVDAPERWTITEQVYQGGAWQTTASSIFPYDFCPIAHCQHLPRAGDVWGEADLTPDVLHVIDTLNRIASLTSKTIRYWAHPILYSTGMGNRQLDRSVDAVLHLPSETAKLQTVEMQGDMAGSLAFLDRLFDNLCMVTHLPAVVLGRPDNMGAPSGVAMKIRYGPLVARTEQKRRTYGDMIEEIDRRLLAMGGFGDATMTSIRWPSLVPVSDLEERQVAVLDESLGIVSKATLAERFDLDYQAEQDKIAEEKAAEPVPPTPPVPPPAPLAAPFPTVAPGIREQG